MFIECKGNFFNKDTLIAEHTVAAFHVEINDGIISITFYVVCTMIRDESILCIGFY